MPEFPFLPLPQHERGSPPVVPPFPRESVGSRWERQKHRVGHKFTRLRDILASDKKGISLRDDPSSIAPERALVLELSTSVENFHGIAKKIDGLEFLIEEEIELEPDADFHHLDTRKDRRGQPRMDKPVRGCLYVAMPDVTALNQLLSLWEDYQNEKKFAHGFAKWKTVFECLYDLRPWGPLDRLTDDTSEFWREEMREEPRDTYRIEVELWFHDETNKRQSAYRRVESIISSIGGDIVTHAIIEEIRYEAILVDIPAHEINRLIDREEIHLVICDDVMFLRPQSSVDVPSSESAKKNKSVLELEPVQNQTPIAAILDGIPIQNHQLLKGRLAIDDPEDFDNLSVVSERHHGTAMASLILHGDRNLDGNTISRKLHLSPVLYAPGNGQLEESKQDRLLVDVVYRAIRRMKEGDGVQEATAPEVFLVNLSLGDRGRPFSGPISPWARLLDYLANRYGILFLVSAGNVKAALPVDEFSDWVHFEDAGNDERQNALLQALYAQKAFRTLLSPAEAFNVVTIGAQHEDALNGQRGALAVDPYLDNNIPNISSALGLGYRKVIKPDIHLPGGREHVTFESSNNGVLKVKPGGRYGLKVAAPSPRGDLDHEGLVAGTSAAAALATRTAHRLFDVLMDEDGGSMHADMEPQFYSVVVKALLIHRSKWGGCADLLEERYGPHGRGKHVERRDNIARLLGYGFPDIEETFSCAPHRATMVGYGVIEAGKANIHRIPLPSSLEKVTEPRSIIITVAWFSPINPRHQMYRQAKLEVDPVEKFVVAAGVERSSGQPSDKSVPRGTIFHTHYEGEKAVSFVNDGCVLMRIFCREQAGSLNQEIRYGIAVTVEAGEGVPVYEEIRTRLGVGVEVRSA